MGARPRRSGDLAEVERLTRDDCSIRLIGWQDDVVPLLRRAELFVLPTVAETNAFAMLEAMACAVPGIVSATAGLAARRPAGVLLVPNQVPEWRRALETAAELDVATRRNLGEQARAWVEAHADCATELSGWDALLA